MTAGTALAFAAAVAAVAGCHEVLVAADRPALGRRLHRAVEPLRRAGAEGRDPTRAERRRMAALAAAVCCAGGWLLGGSPLALAAALAGPGAVHVVAGVRRERYRSAVGAGAAESARALADALSGGHSVRGAIAAGAQAVTGAAGRELRLTGRALALGAPTEEALEALRARAGSRAWDTLVAALLLQRDAGGDLAALLRALAGSLEAAARAERDARAASAQARLSARLVAGMPVAAAALVALADPGFLPSLVAHPVSGPLVLGAVVLQAAGLLAIRRIAR